VEDGPLSGCVCCGAGQGSQPSIFIAVGVNGMHKSPMQQFDLQFKKMLEVWLHLYTRAHVWVIEILALHFKINKLQCAGICAPGAAH
jgi:hypothetical protein